MFQKGDMIVYSNSGVCRVEDIGPLEGATGADRHRQYYTLSLLHGDGTIFAPVDTAVFMRPVLTPDGVNELIDGLPEIQPSECTERSLTVLTNTYRAAFDSHRCEDLLHLMKSIHAKEKDSIKRGKRLGMVDQRYQKKAEELIYGEFAAVLDIPYDEVETYIGARLAQLDEAVNI